MVRTPAVAGQFYEGSRAGLHSQVERYVEADAEKEEVKAVLSPHAGLMYSGPVAGAVYSRIKFPHTFVLLGPNHTGMGPRIAMAGEGIWEIPTAALSIDEGLSASIAEKCPVITRDTLAHRYEHSLEVQLPFIAHFSTDVKIVPISVMQATVDELISVGEGIAEAVKGVGYSVVIVASSDMSHFIPDELAREKDKLAIDKVLALDPRGLFSTVIEKNISMCGFMPATMMLSAANALGAKEAKLVKYTTSAEVSGDYRSVVGYAGVIVK
jgi:AmmeMemoRadiSam system protein B